MVQLFTGTIVVHSKTILNNYPAEHEQTAGRGVFRTQSNIYDGAFL